jgi:hypothetical protein
VDLFRIDNADIHKPFEIRLLGHCKLRLRSSDPTFPSGIIYGVANPKSLADTLRECSLKERTRRRITTRVET